MNPGKASFFSGFEYVPQVLSNVGTTLPLIPAASTHTTAATLIQSYCQRHKPCLFLLLRTRLMQELRHGRRNQSRERDLNRRSSSQSAGGRQYNATTRRRVPLRGHNFIPRPHRNRNPHNHCRRALRHKRQYPGHQHYYGHRNRRGIRSAPPFRRRNSRHRHRRRGCACTRRRTALVHEPQSNTTPNAGTAARRASEREPAYADGPVRRGEVRWK